MNILIVDDEKLIVEDLNREVLELYPKAFVSLACSAGEAIDHAAEHEFDEAYH